jgi:4-alpha-glucanotransferase
MKFNRSSGILLHPTSLPGPDGIGDLGPDAYNWLQTLARMGIGLWQILPLGPTGFGDSPYQCFSAFAGNPLLISSLLLEEDGLLDLSDVSNRPKFPMDHVDFGQIIPWKHTLLDLAFEKFQKHSDSHLKNDFKTFIDNESFWLDDYSLFMAIKEDQKGAPWQTWPEPLKRRETADLDKFGKGHNLNIEKFKFRQFIFHRQWQRLKVFAGRSGLKIIGDIPIFVAYDSADAWANPELFYFDEKRNPKVVAGVPPDYFSETGQLWGNPLYDWDFHLKTNFDWWVNRIRSTLKKVDIIRLDHFRGFVDYWEIPAGMPTAEIGEWKPGPGKQLFDSIRQDLGELPLIAEDLGMINPEVFVLRDKLGLPGMKILQFAFSDDSDNEFLPHNYPQNCVAYTGTHDNDTTIGWYSSASDSEKDFCRLYLAISGEDIAWDLIRSIWSSVAVFAIAPLQDFLRKGTSARMNFPGKVGGNWSWRITPGEINEDLIYFVYQLNRLYSRMNQKEKH